MLDFADLSKFPHISPDAIMKSNCITRICATITESKIIEIFCLAVKSVAGLPGRQFAGESGDENLAHMGATAHDDNSVGILTSLEPAAVDCEIFLRHGVLGVEHVLLDMTGR